MDKYETGEWRQTSRDESSRSGGGSSGGRSGR